MPAGPSSLLNVVAGRSAAPDRPGLPEALSKVPDPRDPVPAPPVLAVAAAAVLAGGRLRDAISESAHDVPYAVRARLELDGRSRTTRRSGGFSKRSTTRFSRARWRSGSRTGPIAGRAGG